MSRSKLILISLAGMFMLAESLYAQKYVGTYSIAFNGYCDGATVTIASNGFITGTHENYDCVGDNTWIDGVYSVPIDRYDPEEDIGPVALLDNLGVLYEGGGALMLYLNFSNQTWSYYLESGGVLPESYVNSGTFSFVRTAATSGSHGPSWKHSSLSHAVAPDLKISGYPTGTYDIFIYDRTGQFEYCDFFQLTAYGDLVGGLHNLATYCEEPSNVPIGGNYAFLNTHAVVIGPGSSPIGVQGRSLLTTDNEFPVEFGLDDDVSTTWYFNFNENVWSVYNTDGTTGLELANWGTFTVVAVDPLSGTTVTHPVGGIEANPLPRR